MHLASKLICVKRWTYKKLFVKVNGSTDAVLLWEPRFDGYQEYIGELGGERKLNLHHTSQIP